MFAIEPKVKFYLNDGSFKEYNIADIDNIGVIKTQVNYNMNIFYQKTTKDTYSTSNIDSMKFESTNNIYTNLLVYKSGDAGTNYLLTDLDSIIFTTFTGPKITSINPSSAKIGDVITISGSGFGDSQDASIISFPNASANQIVTWSNTQIQCNVPVGTSSGKISVIVNSVQSNEVDFTLLTTGPYISRISPVALVIGGSVAIYGQGFGNSQSAGTVQFGNIVATNISYWTSTLIQVIVPGGSTTGKLSVTVNSVQSNGYDYFINSPGPYISSMNPKSIGTGDLVTIIGTGFGSSQGASTVSFGNVKATDIVIWSATQIRVTVPSGVASGKLSVTVNSIKSNEIDYTCSISPNITSISPTNFTVGTSVTINGTNFGATRGTSTVTFNTKDATAIASWSNTKIVCTVPVGATSGSLYITVNSVQSNYFDFTLVTPVETVLIPNGTFRMGNTGTYSGTTYIQELPVTNVTISNSFYMSKYEISQALYTSLVGSNPSNFRTNDQFPVERINWYDACAFCNKLSDRDGYKKCYTINGSSVTCDWTANGWRLPTEAEWEYACKAGTTTDFYTGNNESDLANDGWYSGNSGDSTHTSGLKKPNKFGLYDMLGNVFEWVWDWSGTYSGGSVTDPTGPSSGSIKIIRGGSWHNGVATGLCRSSARGWMDNPSQMSSTNGIRVVRLSE